MIYMLYISLILFACISGRYDAALFSRKGHEAYSYDIHYLIIAFRISVGLIAVAAFFLPHIHALVFGSTAGLLAFSFFHNGVYYEARKRIDRSYNGFFDQTKTPTAFSLGPALRSIMFVLSLLILIVYEVFI